MKKIALLTGAACLALGSLNVVAEEDYPELYLGASSHQFDDDRGLENSTKADLGIAFPITNNFFVEGWGQFGDVEAEGSNQEADSHRISLGGLYQFDVWDNTKPFLSAGLSNRRFDNDLDDSSGTFGDVGLGIKHYFTDKIIARAEVIVSNSIDGDGWNDKIARLAVGYNLGDRGTPEYKAPAPVIAAPTPAPVIPAAPVDSDGDGVFDADDQCPNTASRLKVGLDGCAVVLTETVNIDLEVKFPTNSAVVSQGYYNDIRQVADFLAQYKGTAVEIRGYTDDRGAASYNQALSDRRAKAVAAVLVSQFGVDSSRVTANGYGEINPIGDNNTAEGRSANRRVVAAVSAQKTTEVER